MDRTHRLLQRQLKRYLGDARHWPEGWENFLSVVNRAYWDSDADREMLERSLEISSQELIQANSAKQAVIEAYPDIFFQINQDGMVVSYQEGQSHNQESFSSSPISKPFSELFGQQNRERLQSVFNQVLQQGTLKGIEFYVDNGYTRQHYEARLFPSELDEVFAIVRDITERKMAEEQLIYYSMFDPLTNLYNRAYFEKEMHRFQNDYRGSLGLIICDVDNLKLVNDNFGHDAGDKLLIEIASVLRQSLRKNDVIARIGGDEFAVLLPDSDTEAVESTCTRIRSALKNYNSRSPLFPLSVSLGYSIRFNNNKRMDDIFKEADDNMYREKFIHHSRLSRHLVRNVLETDGAHNFNLQGYIEKLDEKQATLNIQISRTDADPGEIKMAFRLKDEGIPNADTWSIDVGGSQFNFNNGDYKAYLKSLVLLLNIALGVMPEKANP